METQENTIEQRVRIVIAEQLCAVEADINNENSLADDLGADSLDEVELAMALEDEFDIAIPDGDIDAIETVQQAIDYITSKVQP